MHERPTAPERLRAAIAAARPKLARLDDERAARPPAPGKWSPKEVLGHLIDSAANNHQRFVRARFQDDLVFPGYDQDAWIAAQRYSEARWSDLVELWSAYNLHLVRVLEALPAELASRPAARHNLDAIAFGKPPERPALAWFAHDYVDHLEHHLRQIAG
jgi:hypothetical protein